MTSKRPYTTVTLKHIQLIKRYNESGMPNAEIARKMNISGATVARSLAAIRGNTAKTNRHLMELARLAKNTHDPAPAPKTPPTISGSLTELITNAQRQAALLSTVIESFEAKIVELDDLVKSTVEAAEKLKNQV